MTFNMVYYAPRVTEDTTLRRPSTAPSVGSYSVGIGQPAGLSIPHDVIR